MDRINAIVGLPLPIYWEVASCMAYDILTGSDVASVDECQELIRLAEIDGHKLPKNQIVPSIISKYFEIRQINGELWPKENESFNIMANELDAFTSVHMNTIRMLNPHDMDKYLSEVYKPALADNNNVAVYKAIDMQHAIYTKCGLIDRIPHLMWYLAPPAMPLLKSGGFVLINAFTGDIIEEGGRVDRIIH